MQMKVVLSVLLSLCACSSVGSVSVDHRIRAKRLITVGTQHLRARELREARGVFEVAYDLAQLPEALDGLGCVELLGGDLRRAEKYFIRAYQIDQHYRNSIGNLALLYSINGEQRKAISLYKRAIAENPANFRFRNNLAVLLTQNGSRDVLKRIESLEILMRAQALTDDSVVMNNTVKLRRELRDG